MKVLSLDPGAKRMGFAVVIGDGTSPPRVARSGYTGLAKDDGVTYHSYRMHLIHYFETWASDMLDRHMPDALVNETLPVKGFNDMSQALLAATAITTVQTVAISKRIVVSQLHASSVKVAMTGSGRATKVKVRNGVIELVPELAIRKSGWTKEFDEPDAIAVGLTFLGYDNSTH